MKSSTLPDEILFEIFARVPVKSVCRFKCISKIWLTNLSTPEFINLHLTRTKSYQQEEYLLLISDVLAPHTIASPIKDNMAVAKELSGLSQNWKRVLGSCNGLVLLLNVADELFLVNPLRQRQVRVPHPPFPLDFVQQKKKTVQMFGFGYDLSKDDYKILSISTHTYARSSRRLETFAYVYSLKMGIWRRVPCDFHYRSIFHGPPLIIAAGAHVNGVIYWFMLERISDNSYVLATFNLVDEVFGVIPFPEVNDVSRLIILTVSVLRGCLVLVKVIPLERVVEVCMLKENGVWEPWTNLSIHLRGSINIEPLYFIGENEVVVLGDSLLLSNLKTQATETMVVNGAHTSFLNVCVFIGSLVSPSSFTLVAEEKNGGTDFANKTLEVGPSQAPPGSSG